MKRKLAILCSVTMLAATAFAAASCEQEEGGQSVGEYVTVYDFEKTGLIGLKIAQTFGAITLNTDPAFVKDGKQSAKLMPSNAASKEPYMYMPFESGMLGFNYRNTSEIAEVMVDVYAERATTVKLGMYFSDSAELKSTPDSYKLQEGWNTLSYVPSYSVISVQYALDDFRGIYLMFDGKTEAPPTVYLDNVKFKKEAVSVETEDLIILKRTSTYSEICDFEKAYQSLVFAPYGTSSASAPDLKVVKASDYGLTAASGEKMLRIELYPATGSGGAWTQIDMATALIEKLNFPQYIGQEDKYELKLDFYQPETTEAPLLFELNPYYNSNNQDWSGLTSKRGEWIHFSKPLGNFSNFLASPVRFAFAWMNPKEDGEYVYYLDNIRIEKVG